MSNRGLKINHMDDVKLKLDEKGNGDFYIMDGEEQVAKMEISISGNNLTGLETVPAEPGP